MSPEYVEPKPERRAAVLASLARSIARDVERLPLAARLCHAYAEVLAGTGSVITLGYTQPDRMTLYATDDVAARIDGLQEVLGEGPGWDAFTTRSVIVADLLAPTPWQLFGAVARTELGGLLICAAPMRPVGEPIGVAMVYQSPDSRQTADPSLTQFVADAVGAALLGSSDLLEDDPGPWRMRQKVHQATGMVMAQLAVGQADSMALLRAHAYAHDTTVEAISELVLDRELDFSASADPEGPR